MNTLSGVIMYTVSGELRTLLVLASGRLKRLPEVPTGKEVYGESVFGVDGGWSGILTLKGVPGPIVKTLHDALKKGMEDPDFLKMCDKVNHLPGYKSSEDFSKEIKARAAEVKAILEREGEI